MHIGCDFKKWQVAPNKWKIYTDYSTEILWDESNWKTLCKECHKKTESHWSNQWKR